MIAKDILTANTGLRVNLELCAYCKANNMAMPDELLSSNFDMKLLDGGYGVFFVKDNILAVLMTSYKNMFCCHTILYFYAIRSSIKGKSGHFNFMEELFPVYKLVGNKERLSVSPEKRWTNVSTYPLDYREKFSKAAKEAALMRKYMKKWSLYKDPMTYNEVL